MAKETKDSRAKKRSTPIERKGGGQAEPSKTPAPIKVRKPPQPPKK
jgi:hypothetical protein